MKKITHATYDMKNMKRIIISGILGLLLATSSLWAQQGSSKHTLWFNNKAYEPQPNAAQFIANKDAKDKILPVRGAAERRKYMVLQFSELPSKEEIESYKAQGIELLQYIDNNAYFATVSTQKDSKYKNMDKLYSAFETGELNKIDVRIRENRIPDYAVAPSGKLKISVSFYKGVSKATVQDALKNTAHEKLFVSERLNYFEVWMSPGDIEAISAQPWVINISLRDPEPVLYDTRNRGVSGENLYLQRNPSQTLTGKGIKVGIWDGNIEEHAEVMGRLTVNQSYSPDYVSDHGMHVMGIMSSTGIQDPRSAGIAPGLKIETYNYSWDPSHTELLPVVDQMYESYVNKGIRVSQNSYGPAVNAAVFPKYEYSARSASLDNLSNQAPELLNVFACGNSGLSDNEWSTAPYSAKNILLVANVDYASALAVSSSRGPTMSGMILPQVAAIGEEVYSLSFDNKYTIKSGTSMACPFVSGVAGLVYQRYNELYGKNPIGSLAKAFICNGANDIFIPGPDFGTGFGEVNVPNTMEMVEKKQFFTGTIHSTGNVEEYVVTIPQGVEEMKVMLAWNDPYAIPEATGRTLINNLDLEVVYDRTYLPLVPDPMQPDKPAVERVDDRNNILQVTLKSPAPGKARIRVKGASLPQPSQEFAVVYAFSQKGITLLTPVTGLPITANGTVLLKWKSVGLSGPVMVEFSKDGGLTYTTFGNTTDSRNALFLPVASQVTEKFRLRISQDGHFFETGDMPVIGQVQNLKATLGGTTSALSWNAVDGISEYEVLRLKDDNASYEVIATVNQTNYTLTSAMCPKHTYFTVRAKYNSVVGERAVAVAVDPLKSISKFPLHIDFNEGIPEEIRLMQATYSSVRYKYIPEHKRTVLMYEGNLNYTTDQALYTSEWGGPASQPVGVDTVLNKIFDYPGTYSFRMSQATVNTNVTGKAKFLSRARLTVDLPAGKNIIMKIKMRVRSTRPDQSKPSIPNPENQNHHALFRVRVNDMPLKSADGNIVQVRSFRDYTPQYEYNPLNIRLVPDVDKNIFEDKYYNLTPYAGQTAIIDLDAICATVRHQTAFDGEGSQVYIASIDIEEQKPYEMVVTRLDSAVKGARSTNWTSLGVVAADLVGSAQAKPVYARVANIGYMPASGNVRLDVARYAAGDTVLGATAATPVLQPFTAKFISMGNVQFSYPESHNLLFTVNTSGGDANPGVSYIEYNVDSYESNTSFYRMSAGGEKTSFIVKEPVRFTDFGATIFPYLRYAGYNYPYFFLPTDGSKRIQIKMKNIDLMPGDTLYIKSDGKILGKFGGKMEHDTTIVSIAPNGSMNFSVEVNPLDSTEVATRGGWEGEVSAVERAFQRDLAIIGPAFTRPQTFSDGLQVSLIIENRGAEVMPLTNFKPSYKYGSMAKVLEASPYYVSYASNYGPGATQILSLDPGKQAIMTFSTPIIGDTSIHVNQMYDMTLSLEALVDEVMDNNMMTRKLLYGDGATADDFGPNAFVNHFEMAGVSRTDENYGYHDFSNQVIKVELGKGYPYQLILDGHQSKLLDGVFIPDYNHNKVFEDSEVIALDSDGSENHNVYTGEFWPHMYFSEAGDYRFRVAAYQNGNMSAWEFTLRVTGTPVSKDVRLRSASLSGSKLIASSIGELTMDVEATGYDIPAAASVDIAYVNAQGSSVFSKNIPVGSIGDGRQNISATIPVPATIPEGDYTLNVIVNAGDPITANNTMGIATKVKQELILNTTTAKGRVAYVAPISEPQAAGRRKASLPSFKASNMYDATWITDSDKGIDDWYLLSEQYTRAFDNKVFYDNRLVRFSNNETTETGSYDTLAQAFNSAKITAISFNPKSKTLYGLGRSGTDLAIYTIDYETGAATLLHAFTGIAANQFTGLAVDLGDNLYSVKNKTEVVLLNKESGVASPFAAITATIPGRVNMAYNFGKGALLLAFQDAANVGQLYEVIPMENRLKAVGTFGTTNQSYSLGIAAVSNQPVDTLFRLDRFDVDGQLYSLIDNQTKSVTIVLPSAADKANLTIGNYSFANSNAKFQKTGTDVPQTGAAIDLSSSQTLTALKDDGATATWTIKAEDALTTGVRIEEFRFLKMNNPSLPDDIQAVINNGQITAAVPSNIDLRTLVPFIKTNVPTEDERLMIGEQRIYSQQSKVDFSSSLLLVLNTQQLQMNASYIVDVTRVPSSEKQLLSLAFTQPLNKNTLDNTIDLQNDNGRLSMTFPRGIDRRNLVPTLSVSPYATPMCNGKEITSGFDAIDASAGQLIICVVAEDGTSMDYTVEILTESAEAKLLAFGLSKNDNPLLSAAITGTIDETNKQAGLLFPVNVNRTSLVPSFSVSNGAVLKLTSTGAIIGAGSTLNFTEPFDITVVAANGVAAATYKVMPYVQQDGEAIGLQPNPAGSYTMMTGATGAIAYLYDAAGRLLRTISITSDTHHIDLSGLAGGAYYFRVIKNGEVNTVMLLKK